MEKHNEKRNGPRDAAARSFFYRDILLALATVCPGETMRICTRPVAQVVDVRPVPGGRLVTLKRTGRVRRWN